METNTGSVNDIGDASFLSEDVGEAVPIVIDDEESTVPLPAGETMSKVVDGRLR